MTNSKAKRINIDFVRHGRIAGSVQSAHGEHLGPIAMKLVLSGLSLDIEVAHQADDIEAAQQKMAVFRWSAPVPKADALKRLDFCRAYLQTNGEWQLIGCSLKIFKRWFTLPTLSWPMWLPGLKWQGDGNGVAPTNSPKALEAAADIIVFAPIDWHWRKQRYQFLSQAWAAMGLNIAFISPETINNTIRYDIITKDDDITRVSIASLDHVDLASGPISIAHGEKIAHSIVTLGLFDPKKTQMCVAFPNWAPVLEAFPDCKIVYDCADLHDGFDHIQIGNTEAYLAQRAQCVFASSQPLINHLKNKYGRADVIICHNGVDKDWLSAKVCDDLSPPIVGYVGAIEAWIDFQFVFDLARLRPTWQFEIIGSGASMPAREVTPFNVRFVGEKAPAQVQTRMGRWSVGLIPFKTTPLTDAVNPLKFYEYLALGCIVVGTQTQALRDLEFRYTCLDADPHNTISYIEEALQTDKLTRRRLTFDAISLETWDKRAFAMWQAMNNPALTGITN